MLSGFLAVFCPLLALEVWACPGLAAIWLAKAALNVWRLGGAMYLIFWLFMPHFGQEHGEAQPAGRTSSAGGGSDAEPATGDVLAAV